MRSSGSYIREPHATHERIAIKSARDDYAMKLRPLLDFLPCLLSLPGAVVTNPDPSAAKVEGGHGYRMMKMESSIGPETANPPTRKGSYSVRAVADE